MLEEEIQCTSTIVILPEHFVNLTRQKRFMHSRNHNHHNYVEIVSQAKIHVS